MRPPAHKCETVRGMIEVPRKLEVLENSPTRCEVTHRGPEGNEEVPNLCGRSRLGCRCVGTFWDASQYLTPARVLKQNFYFLKQRRGAVSGDMNSTLANLFQRVV